MVYTVDSKTKKVTLTPDILQNSQYDTGMQNKKMERQTIKWLTPKYGFKSDTSWQTVTDGSDNQLNLTTTWETNDNRFFLNANVITAPANWLYNIEWYILMSAYYTWARRSSLVVNWSKVRIVGYNQEDTPYLLISYVTYLDQWDKVSLWLDNQTWWWSITTLGCTLRLISYVLF